MTQHPDTHHVGCHCHTCDAGRLASMESRSSTTYVVGLPVLITVNADGSVSYEVDTAEAWSTIAEEYDAPAAHLDAVAADHRARVEVAK